LVILSPFYLPIRPIRKIGVILFSPEINFAQGQGNRILQDYISFTNIIPSILFEKLNLKNTGLCASIASFCAFCLSKGYNFAFMDCFQSYKLLHLA
jgi:hypothetical protein